MPDLDHHREIIANELRKDAPDWKLIEDTSRRFVDQDPDSVRFSVDAAHIQRLGEQLVGKQETALSELIKNGFDADATSVSLTFSRQASPGGTLVIEDNGVGMDEDVIRSSWMRISTNAKSEEPVSSVYRRVRAGKKGIGRFAVQRLGRTLLLETRPLGTGHGYRVRFDWDAEFTAGRDLNDVFSSIERFGKDPADAGTALRIGSLRDGWSPAAIERVWRSVVLLQPPFDLSLADPAASPQGRGGEEQVGGVGQDEATGGEIAERGDGGPKDPGFQVTINGMAQEEKEELFSIEKSFLALALARITATIDADGVAEVHLESEKLGLDDRAKSDVRFLITGPLRADARYFIYARDLLVGVGLDLATRMGREFGGVRVYRNGFRVLPYGELKDDWLGLDADTARRNILLPGTNRNFFGEIRLTASANPLFEETSSREGLLENEAFAELRTFVRWALEWAMNRVGEVRNRKRSAGERNFVPVKRPSEIIRTIRDASRSPHGDLALNPPHEGTAQEPGTPSDRTLADAEAAALEYEREMEAARAASLEYEEMLRILASLGLSISVFGHEVKGARGAMASNIMLMKDVIEDLPDGSARTELDERQQELARAADRLFDIGGYIAGLMTSTEVRELRDLSVLGAVERFARQFGDYMRRQKVRFTIDVEPQRIRTAPMHASELDSVLLNFLTNSIKSMAKARVPSREVRVEGRLDGDHIVLAFEDNGVGIVEEDRDRIFNAFFTTTGGAHEDGVAGPGTGLGLKIVSDIAGSYGGDVRVADPSPGYACRLEFRVLASKPGAMEGA